ncbi:MAG: TolC family protein [Comamonadaceae bacterium]|nr:TolC family protein [Comamonadaceae bacterium]
MRGSKKAKATLDGETQTLAVRVAEAYLRTADRRGADRARRGPEAQLHDAARRGAEVLRGGLWHAHRHRRSARAPGPRRAQWLQARQNRLIAHRQLQAMVTQPFDRIAPIAADALTLFGPSSADLDAWLAKAEAQSPEMRAARAQLDAARLEIDKARAGHKPTLDVVAEWGRSQSDNINRIGSRYTNKMVGLQLNVPLFAGGAAESAIRQAVAEEQRASEQLRALRGDLGIRVYREYAGVMDGVLRVRALEQALRSAEQVVLSNTASRCRPAAAAGRRAQRRTVARGDRWRPRAGALSLPAVAGRLAGAHRQLRRAAPGQNQAGT